MSLWIFKLRAKAAHIPVCIFFTVPWAGPLGLCFHLYLSLSLYRLNACNSPTALRRGAPFVPFLDEKPTVHSTMTANDTVNICSNVARQEILNALTHKRNSNYVTG